MLVLVLSLMMLLLLMLSIRSHSAVLSFDRLYTHVCVCVRACVCSNFE
jgi:hypothetical protein